jgi:hypothetical protein
MELGKDNDKQIDIIYEYDANYRLVATNGIYGGITPRGDLKADFFVEFFAVPKSTQLKVTEEGKGEEQPIHLSESYIARKIQIGILVPPDQIESFGKWFLQKADDLNRRRGKDQHASQSK